MMNGRDALNEEIRRRAGRGRFRVDPPIPKAHQEINEALRKGAGRVVASEADRAAINRELREAAGRPAPTPQAGAERESGGWLSDAAELPGDNPWGQPVPCASAAGLALLPLA